MHIVLELSEKELRQLVLEYFRARVSVFDVTSDDIKIEVKSKQNYKSEWEQAAFRARLDRIMEET